jgi:glycosyltransferase involved in cell wall biosynthesis
VSLALAHRVLCISRAVSEELLYEGASPGKILVMPVPVDLDIYARASGDGVRTELGLSDSDVLISSVGHAVPVKGWDVLIGAFARVHKVVPQARLLLVGSTDAAGEAGFSSRLRELVRQLSLGDRVRFLGSRNDIPRLLAATDVFAFPSRSEGQGLALTEALACGLPCVATRAGGIEDLVQHGLNGLLVSREDAVALAESLIEVIRNQGLRERLKTNARRSVASLGLRAATTCLIRLYEDLLAQNGCPPGSSASPHRWPST